MSRLIDADAFRRELDNHWPFTKEEQSKHGIADSAKGTVLTVLGQMPTIEERKRGKWECGAICSVCGERCDYYLSGTIWIDELPNYCPNCGAEMENEQ